jgi:cyclohexa-1,5-dienecarbonyl-CoA hydratase
MIGVERIGRCVHLKLQIPPVNVIDTASCNMLAEKVGELKADESIAALFLSGEGKGFSAGASVEEHRRENVEGMLDALLGACRELAEFPAPTVALVHGMCLGGAMELIAFCDFVVADPGAKFGQPEIQLAFFPPLACGKLAKLIGPQRAAHMIFTGRILKAEPALEVGLVQEIVPQDEWPAYIERFNGLSAPVLRLSKQALLKAGGGADFSALDRMKELFLTELYKIEDLEEGIASFAEKRKPEWKHR